MRRQHHGDSDRYHAHNSHKRNGESSAAAANSHADTYTDSNARPGQQCRPIPVADDR
jgi:hypothetical protein